MRRAHHVPTLVRPHNPRARLGPRARPVRAMPPTANRRPVRSQAMCRRSCGARRVWSKPPTNRRIPTGCDERAGSARSTLFSRVAVLCRPCDSCGGVICVVDPRLETQASTRRHAVALGFCPALHNIESSNSCDAASLCCGQIPIRPNFLATRGLVSNGIGGDSHASTPAPTTDCIHIQPAALSNRARCAGHDRGCAASAFGKHGAVQISRGSVCARRDQSDAGVGVDRRLP
jgi:hypothetical protein